MLLFIMKAKSLILCAILDARQDCGQWSCLKFIFSLKIWQVECFSCCFLNLPIDRGVPNKANKTLLINRLKEGDEGSIPPLFVSAI